MNRSTRDTKLSGQKLYELLVGGGVHRGRGDLHLEPVTQDFTELMKEYGEDGVIDYIKAMEFKRLHKGGK